VLSVEPFGIVRYSVGCEDQSCSWVLRKGRDREEKKEDLLAESLDKNCMLILIYYKAQFCGRSPIERVNHVYLLLCVRLMLCPLSFGILLLQYCVRYDR
jgi:hypothetical protein